MKILLAVLVVGGLALLLGASWLFRAPTTDLTDASGAKLTAGVEAAELGEPETELYAGSLFDEARALLRSGRPADAKALLLEVLETTERDGEACILLCEATRDLGEGEEAVDYGLKAVELLPESAPAHLAYARALSQQMLTGSRLAAVGLVPRWKDALRRVIELDPRDIEARTDLTIYYTYVPRLLGGDIDRAIELAREIEAIDSVRGKQFLSMAHHQKGETDEAIAICRAALEEAPGQRALQNTLAGFYAAQERSEEANAAFEAARSGPRDEHYYRSLYLQAEMWIAADERLEEAAAQLAEFVAAQPRGDLMPRVSHALLRRGAALEALGRQEEARAAYEECLRLEPESDRARAALEDLGDG